MKNHGKRLPKGRNYWYIDEGLKIQQAGDDYLFIDNGRYDAGNYFTTIKKAESAANKFRAVLAGADVIETPGKVEALDKATRIAWKRQFSYPVEDGTVVKSYDECYDSAMDMFRYLKSKFIK